MATEIFLQLFFVALRGGFQAPCWWLDVGAAGGGRVSLRHVHSALLSCSLGRPKPQFANVCGFLFGLTFQDQFFTSPFVLAAGPVK